MNRRSIGWMGIAAIALIVSLLIGASRGAMAPAISLQASMLAQAPSDAVPTTVEAAPALSGRYEDPQGTFQIGLLDGVITTTAGGSPLFTLPDGSLSYSVVQLPLDSENLLPEVTLVALTNQALNNGEGFQTQTFTSVPQGLQIDWTGRLSQGNSPPQPISGSVLANQQGARVYLLVVAALEEAAAQVSPTLVALAASLEFL
ncbi:MAG: hypothetical protein AAGD09_08970 [Cyanobacteria bacterium P01_F01_bin.56]